MRRRRIKRQTNTCPNKIYRREGYPDASLLATDGRIAVLMLQTLSLKVLIASPHEAKTIYYIQRKGEFCLFVFVTVMGTSPFKFVHPPMIFPSEFDHRSYELPFAASFDFDFPMIFCHALITRSSLNLSHHVLFKKLLNSL